MDRHIREASERGFFNGCILLAQGNEILYETALGIADIKNERALNIDSVFELASVSKQFTASAIMVLRDQGLLSLEDGLEKYFPGIPYEGRTIKNLLNHTGGLPDYMDWVREKADKLGCIPENSIIEEFILESGLPALFKVNEDWSYSNTGYALLALIVEKVSHISYGDFLKDKIFQPAGMEKTCVYHRRLHGDTMQNYAYGYVLQNDRFVLPDDSSEHQYVIPLDGIEGDGIVNSNVHDLLKWSMALKEGRILSRETQEEMYTPARYGQGLVREYGYGWIIDSNGEMGSIVHHSGGWPGYYTEFYRYIDQDLTLIMLTNMNPFDWWGVRTFKEGLEDIVRGKAPRPIRASEELRDRFSDPSKYSALCGKYEKGIEVFMRDGKLYIAGREFEKAQELCPAKDIRFITREGYQFIFKDKKMIFDAGSLAPTIFNKLE